MILFRNNNPMIMKTSGYCSRCLAPAARHPVGNAAVSGIRPLLGCNSQPARHVNCNPSLPLYCTGAALHSHSRSLTFTLHFSGHGEM